MLTYLTINTIAELLCFLVSAAFLLRDREPAWRFLVAYMALTCITEMAGIYVRRVLHVNNAEVYNLFILAECGMNSYFFYYLYRTYAKRLQWFRIWIAAFLILYFAERIYDHFRGFVALTATMMSVAFVLASIYYYYLMLVDGEYVRLKSYAPFWWVNGTLLFYFGSTATNLFFEYLAHHLASGFSSSIHYVIFNILNVLLYCCWSYSFICQRFQRK